MRNIHWFGLTAIFAYSTGRQEPHNMSEMKKQGGGTMSASFCMAARIRGGARAGTVAVFEFLA
jgi:hypothetical protein